MKASRPQKITMELGEPHGGGVVDASTPLQPTGALGIPDTSTTSAPTQRPLSGIHGQEFRVGRGLESATVRRSARIREARSSSPIKRARLSRNSDARAPDPGKAVAGYLELARGEINKAYEDGLE
jgi:hypothetical protein